MDTKDYDQLRTKIEQRYHNDIDALDRVWQLAHPELPSRRAPSTEASTIPTNMVKPRGGRAISKELSIAGDAAIKAMSSPFGWRELAAAIQQSNPDIAVKRSTLAQLLQRKQESKEIVVVVEGRGRRPAKYRVA
ncbi:MAG: hypothetical protein LLF97_00680 [Planctomycetaceae bacterium]|nr:hypothetical protein [Planctomycetaceae bacterium]